MFATTLAASIAFSLSQGLGRRLAESIINSEVHHLTLFPIIFIFTRFAGRLVATW